MTVRDSQATAIRGHYLGGLDHDTHTLVALATTDLYTGPIDREAYPDYPGFVVACDRIRDALEIRADVWVSEWDEVTEREPDWDACDEEGDLMQHPDQWCHFDVRDVRRIVLGALAEYI